MSKLSLLLLPALLAAAPGTAAAADPPAAPRSMIETAIVVPPALDSCLDHSVFELGFGGKREGRSWVIGGEKVHGTLTRDGGVWLKIEPKAGELEVRMHADWPGAPKEAAVQTELEQRLFDAVTRVARVCGIPNPPVSCTRTPAGGKPEQCSPKG